MSDIEQEDKPWNLTTDRRAHRCVPVRKRRGKIRVGERAECECGVEYAWTATRFGLQWLPLSHGR